MDETLTIRTEQINDLPLLMGIIEEMGIRRVIDAQIRPHGGWQGISVGTVVSIWLSLCWLVTSSALTRCGRSLGQNPWTQGFCAL